ncbi:GLUG motif-containing protein [Aeromicrobium sp. Root344]|uniref:GLUG motif-containing protein n=1 Tax=Aeromicrobium sp. Root344 TaxID=1736521 RepID=UPI0012F82E8A
MNSERLRLEVAKIVRTNFALGGFAGRTTWSSVADCSAVGPDDGVGASEPDDSRVTASTTVAATTRAAKIRFMVPPPAPTIVRGSARLRGPAKSAPRT